MDEQSMIGNGRKAQKKINSWLLEVILNWYPKSQRKIGCVNVCGLGFSKPKNLYVLNSMNIESLSILKL